MRSDADILELFRNANPRPSAGVSTMGAPTHTDDLAVIKERAPVVTDLDTPLETHGRSRTRATTWLAVAVFILFVIAAISIIGSSDDRPTADQSAPTGPEQVARDFLRAEADRDEAAMRAMIEPDTSQIALLPRNEHTVAMPLDDLGLLIDFWSAEGTSVGSPQCTTIGISEESTTVRCRDVVENRLTEHRGADPVSRTTVFRIRGSMIASVLSRAYQIQDYQPLVLDPFVAWLSVNHPESLDSVYTFDESGFGPVLTTGNIQRLDELITEYVSVDGPPTPSEAFLAARADRDSEAVEALLAPDAAVQDLWISSVSQYEGLMAYFEAVDWTEEYLACGLVDPGPPTALGCVVNITTVWSGGGGTLSAFGPTETVFIIGEEGITEVTTDLDLAAVDQQMRPWFLWLEENHPDALAVMYDVIDGIHVPQFTPEALDLFATLPDVFVADS